jgi:hypothetical protein
MTETITIPNVDISDNNWGTHGIFFNKKDGTNVLQMGYGAIFSGPYMMLRNPKNKDLWISNNQYDGPYIEFMSGSEPLMDRPSIVIGKTSIQNERTGTTAVREASIGIFDKNGKLVAIMPKE